MTMNDLPSAATILDNLIVMEHFVDAPTCRAFVAVHQQFGTLTSASDNGFYLPDTRYRAPATFHRAKEIIDRITTLITHTYQERVGCGTRVALCAERTVSPHPAR